MSSRVRVSVGPGVTVGEVLGYTMGGKDGLDDTVGSAVTGDADGLGKDV
jgi:hypothetical protein